MNAKIRTIEVDSDTAAVLERAAAARGQSVADLLADLAGLAAPLPPDLAAMEAAGQGPWSPEALAEDTRRIEEFQRTRMAIPFVDAKAWVDSWGTANELPRPRARKL